MMGGASGRPVERHDGADPQEENVTGAARPLGQGAGRFAVELRRAVLERARRWGPLMFKFLAAQATVQAFGALTGIILVRSLSKVDYALYTIAVSGLAALVGLSNSGITYGVTAIGGRAWQESRRLGQVVVTALGLRTRLGLITALPTAVLLVWLLRGNDASTARALALLAAVLATAAVQFTYGILLVVPQLRGQVRTIQYLDLGGAAARLVLVAAFAYVLLDAWTALLVGTLVGLVQLWRLRRLVRAAIDMSAPSDPAVATELKTIIRRQWLNELYHVFQGQIYVFLLGAFGTTESVADLGALNRISMVFAVLMAAMQAIVLPRYARQQEPGRLARLHLLIFCGYVVAAALPVVLTWLCSHQILWILGGKYLGLDRELLLVAASAAMASTAGIAWAMNATRGWIIPGWIAVPLGLVSQGVIMAAVGTSTLYQVVTVGILSNGCFIFIQLAATAVFMRSWRRRPAPSVTGALS